MGFFLGIYDADTVNAALVHPNRNCLGVMNNRKVTSDDYARVMQDWNDLIEKFTWRQQPALTAGTSG